jgi:hypothetical protein
LTFDDIKDAFKEENNENEQQTLIAIKAPIGTKIEIPDPQQVELLYQGVN